MIDTAILRLSFPILAVGLAVLAEERGWGLFNIIEAPFGLAVILSMLLLDLAIYLQHVMFHAVPALWRLHRMHHADLDFDATTGLRFHPIEILISMAIKLALVAALGPPAVAVLLFEIILNATALFNHANINLPRPVDRWLRWIVVTPDMHRVHHSVDPRETNCRVAHKSEIWRVEHRILPLNARCQRLRVEFPRFSAESLVEPCLRFKGKNIRIKGKISYLRAKLSR